MFSCIPLVCIMESIELRGIEMSIEAEVRDRVLELDNDYKDNGFLLFIMGLKFNVTIPFTNVYICAIL